MKIAILISGHVRTFVFKEQRRFFKHFIKSLKRQTLKEQSLQVDVYVMLKMDDRLKTHEGIYNLKKMLTMLKPVYSILFEKWRENNDVYFSQMKMIQHLCIKALPNNYDCFIRIRPDLVLNETIDLSRLSRNRIYTSYKYDSIGNDQFIIMSKEIVINWFLKIPMYSEIYDKLPDYVIFNNVRPFVSQIVGSGLVRDYKKIDTWNTRHNRLNPTNYWIKKFKNEQNENYIEELKKIILYQTII